jgi:hypothetical protein
MRQQVECQYCGHLFACPMKKMWVIWVCNVHETISESGEHITIKDRVQLITSVDSFGKATDFKIQGIEDGQCKDIEKIYVNKEKYCPQCKHDAKVYYDRLQARMKREQKQRAIASGDKSGKIAPIADQDMKGFIKFIVDKKVEEQIKAKEQPQPNQQAMDRRRKVFIPEVTHVNTGKEESVDEKPKE